MATISITMAPDVTRRVRVPRAASVDFPLGHPFGVPGNAPGQREVLAQVLRLAAEIREPGTIVAVGEAPPSSLSGGDSRF